MKQLLTILFISLISLIGLSQKFEINLSFDPFVNRLGNLNKQFVAISNSDKQLSPDYRTDVTFYNVIGKQANINMLFKRPKFLIGFDVNYFQHAYRFDVDFGYYLAARKFTVSNMGISFLIGKDFVKYKTKILLGLEATLPFSLQDNIGVPVDFSSSSADVIKEEFFPRANSYIAPKVICNTKISKNIFINYGFRIKFMDRQFFDFYSFYVEDKGETYLDFSINSKQFHFFLGFGYKINSKNE